MLQKDHSAIMSCHFFDFDHPLWIYGMAAIHTYVAFIMDLSTSYTEVFISYISPWTPHKLSVHGTSVAVPPYQMAIFNNFCLVL